MQLDKLTKSERGGICGEDDLSTRPASASASTAGQLISAVDFTWRQPEVSPLVIALDRENSLECLR